MPSGDQYLGQQTAGSDTNDFNAVSFIVAQMMAQACTATLVLVKSVTNAGGVAPVGRVSVQPMVSQIDGRGNATPHGVIADIPYCRLQGGANAIILDPQVGDIGICVFADRDISTVKATKKPGNPGSRRRNAWSDGLYIGGVLNGTPSQFVQFSGAGITITSPTAVKAQVGGISMTVSASGVAIVGGAVTHNGVNIGATHVHSGVQAGGSNTGAPT